MRRILLLPALALVACQTDLPTETGTILAKNQPADATLQIILEDHIVNSDEEILKFVLINPPVWWKEAGPGEQDFSCRASGSLYDLARGEPGEPLGAVLYDIHAETACSDADHWGDLTDGDDEPDVRLDLDGGAVCDALPPAVGSVLLVVDLDGADVDGVPFNYQFYETFKLRCAQPS